MENNVLYSQETIQKLDTFSAEQKSNYMLQRMINDYLKHLNLPPVSEVLNKIGEKEEAGVLTDTHIRLLQCMVKDYYQANNSNLEEVAKQKGIVIVDGQLSSLESECIDALLEKYSNDTIKDYNSAA